MPKALHELQQLPQVQIGGRIFNNLPRRIGLEIEMVNWGVVDTKRLPYKSHRDFDRSIGIEGGYELVTQPLEFDQLIRWTLAFWAYANRSARVDRTCGFHVHVGAGDLSHWDIRRLLIIYDKLEADIFRYMVTPNRAESSYCTPLNYQQKRTIGKLRRLPTSTGAAKAKLLDLLYVYSPTMSKEDRIIDRLKGYKPRRQTDIGVSISGEPVAPEHRTNYGNAHISRYTALNVHSWFRQGTVEWRMKEATLDLEELILWPLFCGWIVELSRRLNEDQIGKIDGLRSIKMHLPKFLQDYITKKIGRE